MREIKFRAWDKEKKEMYEAGIHDGLFICLDGKIGFWNDLGDGFEEKKNLIIMQFTGLHDKNGKEIYEGDILQLNNEKRVYWEVVQDNRNDFPRGWTIKATHPQYTHPEAIRLEIIGNIYKNKELLNATTTH